MKNVVEAFTYLSSTDSKVEARDWACDYVAHSLSKGAIDVLELDKKLGSEAENTGLDDQGEKGRYLAIRMVCLVAHANKSKVADNLSQTLNESGAYAAFHELTKMADAFKGLIHGIYLKGSFWCFAKPKEREFINAAIGEADLLVTYAWMNLHRDTAKDDDLLRTWFGDRMTSATMIEKMEQLLAGMKSCRIGVGYWGAGAKGNNKNDRKYREILIFNMEDLKPSPLNYVMNARRQEDAPTIHVMNRAFHKCRQWMRGMHNTKRKNTGLTRGGAFLHELTHIVLGTKDEEMDTNKGKVTCYFDRNCYLLARSNDKQAENNADNYRLYCEDIWTRYRTQSDVKISVDAHEEYLRI